VDQTVRTIHELTDAALGRTNRGPTLTPRVERHQIEAELGAVAQHAHVDEMPSPAGSLPALKRAVLRVGAFNWMRQRAVNVSVANVLALVLAELDELRATVAQNDRRVAASAAAREAAIDDLRRAAASAVSAQERVNELKHAVEEITGSNAELSALVNQNAALVSESNVGLRSLLEQHTVEIARLSARLLAAETKLLTEQRHTAALRNELARVGNDVPIGGYYDPPPADSGVAELYARFEAAFRPSDLELVRRFEDYLDLLSHLRDGDHPLIDIGAGRGEFVAMLTTEGVPARGVDLSVDAVDEAQRHGRPVELADANAFLSTLDSESVGAVTAFHVIEHLEPEVVLRLLDESLRVLRPGGILIIETPNPTNLNVGAAAFYHDPTHLRPITPTYLEFLVADRGFTDVETRFLHPQPEYSLELDIEGEHAEATRMLLADLRWALKGPQDYAVIARRAALT
jgi:O-antigen chain-terminating methyltransferase